MRAELLGLIHILESVERGIDGSDNLKITTEDLGEDVRAKIKTNPVWYNRLALNINQKHRVWDFTDDQLDSTIFHELTHLYGTEDASENTFRGNVWNNASEYSQEDPALGLIAQDLKDTTAFKFELELAKQCARNNPECPDEHEPPPPRDPAIIQSGGLEFTYWPAVFGGP